MDKDARERQIKESLFGGVRKLKADGGHSSNKQELLAPFRYDGVLRAFCKGCGSLCELSEKGVQNLTRLAGVETPVFMEAVYFEAERCCLCDEDYINVDLKEIEPSVQDG